jgi:hypothetical protein
MIYFYQNQKLINFKRKFNRERERKKKRLIYVSNTHTHTLSTIYYSINAFISINTYFNEVNGLPNKKKELQSG